MTHFICTRHQSTTSEGKSSRCDDVINALTDQFHNLLYRGSFAAEAHLLHYSFTTDSIIYVSILLEETADRLPFTNNSFLDTLWNSRSVPDIASEGTVESGRSINPYENLFPGTYSHFNYVGSLTTPPCTAGARWFIFDTPVPVSSDDVAIIRSSMGTVPDSKISQQGNNNRPVQPKNGRPLYYSYGISSKSEIYVDEKACNEEDVDLAKNLSMVAVGVSALTLVLLLGMWRKMAVECEKEKQGAVTAPRPNNNDNPLWRDSVI